MEPAVTEEDERTWAWQRRHERSRSWRDRRRPGMPMDAVARRALVVLGVDVDELQTRPDLVVRIERALLALPRTSPRPPATCSSPSRAADRDGGRASRPPRPAQDSYARLRRRHFALEKPPAPTVCPDARQSTNA
jgi:hypothetical protein